MNSHFSIKAIFLFVIIFLLSLTSTKADEKDLYPFLKAEAKTLQYRGEASNSDGFLLRFNESIMTDLQFLKKQGLFLKLRSQRRYYKTQQTIEVFDWGCPAGYVEFSIGDTIPAGFSEEYLLNLVLISEMSSLLSKRGGSDAKVSRWEKKMVSKSKRFDNVDLAYSFNDFSIDLHKSGELEKVAVALTDTQCGGGNNTLVDVRLITDPPGGKVFTISDFFFEVCKANVSNPWNTADCRWWKSPTDTRTLVASSDYRYIGSWTEEGNNNFSRGKITAPGLSEEDRIVDLTIRR